jgi:hypothetical protein
MVTFTIGDAEMLRTLLDFAVESVVQKVKNEGATERSIEINTAISWCEGFLATNSLEVRAGPATSAEIRDHNGGPGAR